MKIHIILLSLFMSGLLIFWIQWDGLGDAIHFLKARPGGSMIVWIARALFWTHVCALIWRIYLLTQYRPTPERTNDDLLSCTVIVPAFNEGRMVYQTLKSVQASDYPADKMEILAVDDGSSDDTWLWIERAVEEGDGRIQAKRMPVNRGKRHALYAAFKNSTSDILVTIDSDSLIEPCTLRNLLSGFIDAPDLGATAGNVRVLNRSEGMIPRMLEVIFTFSFELVRASQSAVNGVLCTPGALSAYRREPVMQVLDDWLNQTFLGRPARIGEDRAMTNLMLRHGYAVRFESDARVYTNVPTAYQGVRRMLLRWMRSNVRETILMMSYLFTRFRKGSAIGLRVNVFLNGIHLILPQFVVAGLLMGLLWEPTLFIPHITVCLTLSASIPALFHAFRRRDGFNGLWALPAAFFWLFGLSWIPTYAIASMSDSRWLTRDRDPDSDLHAPLPSAGSTLPAS